MARPRKNQPALSQVLDEATQYAQEVVAGNIITGKLVRQACERHLKDLVEGPKRGLYWDVEAAQRVISFFPQVLVLSSGTFAGKPFELQLWQKFVIGNIFGWKKRNGRRRFNKADIYIARKNGKSELAAGIGLYCLAADGEMGGQVRCVANMREQARLIFDAASRMVQFSEPLRARLDTNKNAIVHAKSASNFVPLAAEAKTMDGLGVSCGLIDEIHEFPDGEIIAKIETSTGARSQPLIVSTTTAGSGTESICFKRWKFGERVLSGTLPYEASDPYFIYIAALDEGDDWRDERNWVKANPNIDVILDREVLRQEVAVAQEDPSKQNELRRYRMNQWTQTETRAIDRALWDRGGPAFSEFDLADLKGRKCYGGLDLAAINDLSSLCLVFPPVRKDERFKALWWNWVPLDNVVKRSREDRVPYDAWMKQKLLIATDGNVTDFDKVRYDIVELSEIYDVQAIGFDRMFGQGNQVFIQDMIEDGLNMVEFAQNMANMSPAVDQFMRLLTAGKFQHGGENHLVNWTSENLQWATDAGGNRRPNKARANKQRIDPMVAAIMAIGMHARLAPEEAAESVYKTKGRMVMGLGVTAENRKTGWLGSDW